MHVVGDNPTELLDEYIGCRLHIDRQIEQSLRIRLAHPGAIEHILTNGLLEIRQYRQSGEGLDLHGNGRRAAFSSQQKVRLTLSAKIDIRVLPTILDAVRIVRNRPTISKKRCFDGFVVDVACRHRLTPSSIIAVLARRANRRTETLTTVLRLLPLNALLIGGVLWLVARLTRDAWQPVWSELTYGLPLIGDLALVLGAVPMLLLIMSAGTRHYPRVFRVIDLLGFGLILAFVATRVWTGWMPLWVQWTAPLPLLPAPGMLIAAAPLLIWLWFEGQKRWPTPFFAANLLLLGGALSLTAYQYQPFWRDAWVHWTAGTTVATMPFMVIAVAPASLWTWSRVSLRWPRIFALPNQLLNGAILWLIADRTRALWTDPWLRF